MDIFKYLQIFILQQNKVEIFKLRIKTQDIINQKPLMRLDK